VPLFTYRTGPFASSGIPIANGMRDYLTMLNERDGGINGVKIQIEECETGYDTKKGRRVLRGREAEEAGGGQSVVDGHHAADHSEGGGRQDPRSVDGLRPVGFGGGNTFPWIFNPPATYWDGMSQIVKYIATRKAVSTS
jgi:branched-chain amino acid transport system substrate-binding protein